MRYYLILVVMVCLMPWQVMAQSDTYEMDEVVVVGSDDFTPKERATAAHNVVFDESRIQNSTAENLSDFLLQMGFAVIPAATAYGDTTIYIRGYDNGHHWNESSSRIVFLINGRRSGVNNIRQLALNNVERVEIIRGPEMYLYTAGSPGGVVNVITKRGGDDVFSGSLEFGLGSYGQKKGQVALNGAYAGFDWSGAYMYETIDDYNDSKGDRVGFSRIDGINAFNTTFGYTFMDNHRLGVELYYYKVDEAGQPA